MKNAIAVPAYVRHPRKKGEEYVSFDELRKNPELATEVLEAELWELVPAIRRVQNLEMALGNPGGLVEKVLVIMSTFSHSEWGVQYPAQWKGTKAEAIATGRNAIEGDADTWRTGSGKRSAPKSRSNSEK